MAVDNVVSCSLFVEEHGFRVDYLSATHPEVFINNGMVANKAAISKLLYWLIIISHVSIDR